ncbi:hypothetical protein [Halococcus saccharolyticus]|uniref:Uncharacterized protein n=1 Tax=Halococcus saccharolyticus DSM 5350 TaxID=1227455 RepID=M0MEM2_9EURY|nr:hypothetical protein [Halococcus saccharolyticus]EMA43109.1 hypothetical protein C449_14062 [Halococcus saccharolyticus DSM 5350]
MQLTNSLIEQKARQYRESVPEYEEEARKIETLPSDFEAGTWSWDDLEWIVKWKSNRSIGYFRQNDPDNTAEVITQVYREDSVTKKLDLLTDLSGVAVRVASAFLVYMAPENHTVLDWRAWALLHETGHLFSEFPDPPSTEDYLIYLGTCRALSREFDTSLRELDRALWVLGGEI